MSSIEKSDPSAMAVWLAVVRTKMVMDRFARLSLDSMGLSLTDFVILESVLHVGPIAPSALGDRVGLTRGSITSAVDRLSARGLVTREPNAADGRRTIIRLTDPGTKVIEAAWAMHTAEIEQVLRGALSHEETTVLFKLLGRLRRLTKKEGKRRRAARIAHHVVAAHGILAGNEPAARGG